jgi:drug/metabolite transporter (DMT)-like permease
MKNEHLKHILQLNVAMMFISTSGVLGRYIQMPPPLTIWWRSLLAVVCLGIFIWFRKISISIASKDRKTILLSGIFMGAHWVTYFYALQLSNVAIGMLSIFTYPIITVFLEPLFFKVKLELKNVLLGLLVLVGIYLLTPKFSLESHQTQGVLFGIISALFYSLRNIIMKQKVSTYHGSMLMFYQMIVIALVLSPVIFFFEGTPTTNDWLGLGALALFTTTFGHTLFVLTMKHFSISSASIMSSIQPVFGILFGILFLSEIPSFQTIIGGSLIIFTVILKSLKK